MTRRIVLAATALSIVGGFTLPALAAPETPKGNAVCIVTSENPRGPHDGVCVWIPLPFAQPN
jgi:hypothetical protein